jgi:hypothetical protein
MRRLLLLCLTAGLAVPTASATAATKTSVTFTDMVVTVGAPGRSWSEDGVLHVRDQPQTLTLSGDLSGSISLNVSLDLRLATSTGAIYGKFRIITDTITWAGSFAGRITPSGASGHFVGQGSDGTKIIGTFTQTGPGAFLDQAIILDPPS